MEFDPVERYRIIESLWARQRWGDWAATTAQGYLFRPGIGPDRGLAATLQWNRAMFRAFPDLTQTVEQVLASGACAVGITTMTATHTGELDLGLGTSMQPSHVAIRLGYVKLLSFDEGGLVVRDQQYFDVADLLDQLNRTGRDAPTNETRPLQEALYQMQDQQIRIRGRK